MPQKSHKNKRNAGYTLIELVVVLFVMVILMAASIGGLAASQGSYRLINAAETMLQTVRQARSLALNGKALADYNDYDNDDKTTDDLVVPANYGVNFNVATKTITLFADLHRTSDDPTQNEKQYNPPGSGTPYAYSAGNDIIMTVFPVDSRLTMMTNNTEDVSIFFSPIFGDATFYPVLAPAKKFFFFGVKENNGTRRRCAKVHPYAGIPEVATADECNAL